MIKTVAVVRGIGINRLPLIGTHQIHVHVKPRHINVRGVMIVSLLAVERVSHRERPCRNERHPGGRVEGKQ